MWLNTTKKIISIMEKIPEDNSKVLDSYINSFSSKSAQSILTNALAGQDTESYLIKTSERIKLVTPVNAINYEILSRRINGIEIDTKKDLEVLRDAIRKKDPTPFKFLPNEIGVLLKLNGATIKDDPFHSLTDDRKLVMPFIATNDEFRRIDDELEILGRYIKEKLSITNLQVNYSNPRGSQKNSFNSYCWLALSPEPGMRLTVHLGLRIDSEGFEALLHIGDKLYEKVEHKLESLPIHFETAKERRGDFHFKRFKELDAAILYLQSKQELCLELNELFKIENFDSSKLNYNPLEEDTDFYPEGDEKLVTHFTRERNSKLILNAKRRFAERNGALYCEKCGFDFEKVYGLVGKGYIEAHHTKPLADLQIGDKTHIDDIQMLCANCHRIEHKRMG